MIDYTKYLHCKDCQDAGLYCTEHRKEVETELKKQAIQDILELKSLRSEIYKKLLTHLLDLYNRQ